MQLVTKRDMFDAEKLIEDIRNSLDDGVGIDEFVHSIAQAIADGRRPVEVEQSR